MNNKTIALLASTFIASPLYALDASHNTHGSKAVSDEAISKQRSTLAMNTKGKGFGPQSPRDIDMKAGSNSVIFNQSPDYTKMNLCNIHFHKNELGKGDHHLMT